MLRCGFCISYVLYFYYHYFYLFLVKRFFLHIARSTFVGVLIGLLWGQSRMIYIWINNIYTCHVADIYKSPCKYTVCVFVCFFFSSLWYFVVGDCGDCGGGGVQLLCKGKYQSQTFIIHCMHIIRLFILICHAFEDFFLFCFCFHFHFRAFCGPCSMAFLLLSSGQCLLYVRYMIYERAHNKSQRKWQKR